MSVHMQKSRAVARARGAAAGHVGWAIWNLPKREIIEVALHLSALCTDSYDATMQDGDKGEDRFWQEHKALKQNGVL